MTLTRIVVCDDDDSTRETFVNEINTAVGEKVAETSSAADLKAAINTILGGGGDTLFDDSDVAVIDNRLIDEWTAPDDPKVSAEQLADMVRRESSVGAVVVVNQYREVDFDLRLDGRLESYADLNITDKCLGSAGLWTETTSDGFRPWAWPVVDRLVAQLSRRVQWLLDGRLGAPVLHALALNDERIARSLSRNALDFLHPSKELSEVTFRDFVTGATRGTDAKNRASLDDQTVAKIAASRLGKWLEAAVLGPQDVLVDVPHLLERFPNLVNDPTSIESWNSAISWSAPPTNFHTDVVAPHLWPLWELWLSRPAFVWSTIQEDNELRAELFRYFEKSAPLDVGFCEDISRFLPIDDTQEFVANFESAFDRRRIAVERSPNFAYGPANRLAR